VQHLLDANGVSVFYDTTKKKLSILIPGLVEPTDNADNSKITLISGLCQVIGMTTSQVPAVLELLADANSFNPVADWIKSKPWDGIDRLPSFYGTVTTREGFSQRLKQLCMRKWMLSAVAAAFTPQGFRARGVLVFQGPQSIGKTAWLQSLVSDPILRDLVIKVDHMLDATNKDSVLGAITHWLVEIGELDSSMKKDVARLKGFLTSNTDKVRRPYARTESEYARRTVFFATVNDHNFLVDHTGNTRWWTIPVLSLNYTHALDMQQIFAQLAAYFERGDEWWLTAEEEALLEEHNQDHRANSVLRDLLLEVVDIERPVSDRDPYKSTTDLFGLLNYKNPKNPDAKELTGILREYFGEPKKIRGTMRWRIPMQGDNRDVRSTVKMIDPPTGTDQKPAADELVTVY
jgi:putative DNA primase/helicase